MLTAGDRVPDVRVQRAPGEEVTIGELHAERPALLVFYLFDWSST
jgi:peroxiredoxin